jgi:hypothetical protein
MHNFRRPATRWEYHIENFLGFVQLDCSYDPAEIFMRLLLVR